MDGEYGNYFMTVAAVFLHPSLYYHIVVTISAELPQNFPHSHGYHHIYRCATAFL